MKSALFDFLPYHRRSGSPTGFLHQATSSNELDAGTPAENRAAMEAFRLEKFSVADHPSQCGVKGRPGKEAQRDTCRVYLSYHGRMRKSNEKMHCWSQPGEVKCRHSVLYGRGRSWADRTQLAADTTRGQRMRDALVVQILA